MTQQKRFTKEFEDEAVRLALIHTSKATTKALAARDSWLTVEWSPRYPPELNDIQLSRRDLTRHHLAHRTFRDAADLEIAVHKVVEDLNRDRTRPHPCDKPRIAA